MRKSASLALAAIKLRCRGVEGSTWGGNRKSARKLRLNFISVFYSFIHSLLTVCYGSMKDTKR